MIILSTIEWIFPRHRLSFAVFTSEAACITIKVISIFPPLALAGCTWHYINTNIGGYLVVAQIVSLFFWSWSSNNSITSRFHSSFFVHSQKWRHVFTLIIRVASFGISWGYCSQIWLAETKTPWLLFGGTSFRYFRNLLRTFRNLLAT